MSLAYSEKLTIADFRKHPVWEWTGKHEVSMPNGELLVESVDALPVTTLNNRAIGTDLTLANGQRVFGELHGIRLNNARITKLVLRAIFHFNDDQFLFRHSSQTEKGPQALASFLRLPISEIFPIRYDISEFAVGSPEVLVAEIPLEPVEVIPREELTRLLIDEEKRRLRADG